MYTTSRVWFLRHVTRETWLVCLLACGTRTGLPTEGECALTTLVGAAPWASAFQESDGGRAIAPVQLAVLPGGDAVVSGQFAGRVDLGGVALNVPSGSSDAVFVARLAPTGEARWARAVPTSKYLPNKAPPISPWVAARNGWIAISGTLNQAGDFGTGILTPVGGTDAVVVAMSSAGMPLWAAQSSGEGNEYGEDVRVACDGSVYASGYYTVEVSFGGEHLRRGKPWNPSFFDWDSYLAAFDSHGTHRWTRTWPARIYAIDATGAGESVIGGMFTQTVDFGAGELTARGGSGDAFVAKLARNGELAWVKQIRGEMYSQLWPVANQVTQADGKVYVGVQFITDISVDGVILPGSAKESSAAILKLDSDGRLTAHTVIASQGGSVAVGPLAALADRVVFAPSFTGRVSINGEVFESNNAPKVLLLSLDSSLAVQSARSLGGEGNNDVTGLVLDARERIMMTGGYTTQITFAAGLNLSRTQPQTNPDMVPFIARLP